MEPEMASMEPAIGPLTINLFGTFEARSGGASIPGLHKRDGIRLLAFLALEHGRPIKTDVLAQTLWAASGSLDSLHQATSNLRRSLADHAFRLQSPKGSLLLDLLDVQVDVERFDTAIVQENVDGLKGAIELYRRGTLLEGWDEVKDRWILPAREKRKRAYLCALRSVASDSLANGDPSTAVPYLRSYVSLNPADEHGWRDLMNALILSGERAAALNVHENCSRIFLNRFKIDPPAEMADLLRQIRPDNSASRVSPPRDGCELNVPRGVVLLESPFYVLRPTDQHFADALARQESVVLLKGPRQTGKTSLLARGLQQARAAGANVVLSDLQSLSEEHWASTESFCRALAQDLADQLDLPVSPADVWNPARGPNRNLQRYLSSHALEHLDGPLVWGLDEVDRLFSYPFSTPVFALFRSWHNARALEPQRHWDRLTLAMAYATEAHLLIEDLNQSPFNIGLQLTLQDFDLEQVADLNRRYRSPLDSQERIRSFFQLVGGSPYLVHRGIYELATRHMDFASLIAESALESGCFGDHLQRVERALVHDKSLCAVVRSFLDLGSPPSAKSFYRLKSAGLLIGEEPESAAWRSEVYRAYLNTRL